ncbi:hypothetical protein ACFL5Z_12545 [Planctomycetota bacterium]
MKVTFTFTMPMFLSEEHCHLNTIKGRRLKLGDTHPHTLQSWHNLIDLYEAWNKPEQAEYWQAKLPAEQPQKDH